MVLTSINVNNSQVKLTLENQFSLVGAVYGYILNWDTGEPLSNQYTENYAISDYIPCYYGDVLEYYSSQAGRNGAAFAVYDRSKNLLGALQVNYNNPNGNNRLLNSFSQSAFVRYSIQPDGVASYSKQYLRIYRGKVDQFDRGIFTFADAELRRYTDILGHIYNTQYADIYAVSDYLPCRYGDLLEFNTNLSVNVSRLANFIVYDALKRVIGLLYYVNLGATIPTIPNIYKNSAYVRYVYDNRYWHNEYVRTYQVADFNERAKNYILSTKDVNLFTLNGDVIKDYAIGKDGEPFNNQYTTDYYITDYIPCHSGDIVEWASSLASNNGSAFAVYDIDKQLIGTIQVEYDNPNHNKATCEYTNAAYVRYTVFPESVITHADNYIKIYQPVDDIVVDEPKTVTVGHGQMFEKFIDGVNYAKQYANSKVIVKTGVYDIIAEYGSEEAILDTLVDGDYGLIVENGVHIICEANVILKAEYTGSHWSIQGAFSILNVRGSFTIENAIMIAKGIRYCVHDDMPIYSAGNAIVQYIDCQMEHKGHNESWSGSYDAPACIGAGGSPNSLYKIKGGTYKSPDYMPHPISYHNYSGNADSTLLIDNVYIADGNSIQFYTMAAYPTAPKMTVRISNSRIANPVHYADGTYEE